LNFLLHESDKLKILYSYNVIMKIPISSLRASKKVHLPFDRPFDKLTVLSKVEGLMALSKAEGWRCASSFVTVAYW
jgi:hypothetical protein